jgi:hypothetical protein
VAARHCAEYADQVAETRATPFSLAIEARGRSRRQNPECAAAGLRAETYHGDAPILQIWMGGDP